MHTELRTLAHSYIDSGEQSSSVAKDVDHDSLSAAMNHELTTNILKLLSLM